jgi:hypothetical protein
MHESRNLEARFFFSDVFTALLTPNVGLLALNRQFSMCSQMKIHGVRWQNWMQRGSCVDLNEVRGSQNSMWRVIAVH